MGQDETPDDAEVELAPELFGRTGMTTFMKAYCAAPDDADVAIRVANPASQPDVSVLVVSLMHPSIQQAIMAVTADEALAMANIAEDAICRFPRDPDAPGLYNLIAGLRQAAGAMGAS